MGKANLVDIEATRKRICAILNLSVEELISNRERIGGRNAVMLRMVAAYVLLCDRLPLGDIARIMDRDEEWLFDSQRYIERRYIERRINGYAAFKTYLERVVGEYVLAPMLKTDLPGVA